MAFKEFVAGEQVDASEINENFLKSPNVKKVAEGTLANGDKVVLNSDGTVSVIAGVNSVVGTPTTVTAAGTLGSNATCYDPVSGKIVVAYQKNAGTSGEGEAVVGTISGSTISFGTPTQFNGSFTNSISICGNIGSSKVLIAFCDYNTSQQGGIIVGTISGTSISFGSKVAFNAGVATNNIDIAWDSVNSKALLWYNSASTAGKASVITVSGTVPTVNTAVTNTSVASTLGRLVNTASNVFVIAYKDGTATRGKAVVATISGTSVSFGTPVDFLAADVGSIGIAYESNAARVVIGYQVVSTTFGTAIVGTVSGTAISFGTPVTFNSTATTGIDVAFDTAVNKIMITFNNATDGKVIIGTVVTTAISFGSAVTFNTGSTTPVDGASLAYATGSMFINVSVISSVLKATNIGTFYTNLTTTNFLGCNQEAHTDGQDTRVGVTGCIDANQSGLTAGLMYYINGDGTLTTDSSKPYFGLALSATEILIKG